MWRADPGGQYWFVGSDLRVYPEVEAHDALDDGRHEAANYFASRTEALATASCLRTVIQYIRDGSMDEAIGRMIDARNVLEASNVERQ